MDIRQIQLSKPSERLLLRRLGSLKPNWIHISTSVGWMQHPEIIGELQTLCPDAVLSGVSSNWQLCDYGVERDSLTLTAIKFKTAQVRQGLWPISETRDLPALAAKIQNHFSGKPLTLMLFAPNKKVDLQGLNTELAKRLSNIQIIGGDSGVVPPTWESFVVCDKGFTDQHIQVLAFDQSIQVNTSCWPPSPKSEKSEDVGFLWFEGSTLSDASEKVFTAKEALKIIREIYAGHYLPSGFFTASALGSVGAQKKENPSESRGFITTFNELI